MEQAKKIYRRHPTTGDKDYTPDEVEFMMAMAEFKRVNRRLNPDCRDMLNVLRSLGYRKVGGGGTET